MSNAVTCPMCYGPSPGMMLIAVSLAMREAGGNQRMTQRAVVIFISEQKLRDAVEALIMSEKIDCRIGLARTAANVESILNDFEEGIILIDAAALTDDAPIPLAEIHSKGWKSLVLVDGLRDQTRMQMAGADVVLLKGYPASDLMETVKTLMQS